MGGKSKKPSVASSTRSIQLISLQEGELEGKMGQQEGEGNRRENSAKILSALVNKLEVLDTEGNLKISKETQKRHTI